MQKSSALEKDLAHVKQKLGQVEDERKLLQEHCRDLQYDLFRASDALNLAEHEDLTQQKTKSSLNEHLENMQRSLTSERVLREAIEKQARIQQRYGPWRATTRGGLAAVAAATAAFTEWSVHEWLTVASCYFRRMRTHTQGAG